LISLGLLLGLFLSSLPGDASPVHDHAVLWGKVLSSTGQPLGNVRLILAHNGEPTDLTQYSSPRGHFQITGLDPGMYAVQVDAPGYRPLTRREIRLVPGHAQYMRITLQPQPADTASSTHVVSPDFTQHTHHTILDADSIYGLPLAHNVWTLVENLDLSATVNRIDVGGLWSGLPALFSGRGSISWTQSVYRLNGLDVTDPYDTGRPLVYPDFYGLDFSLLSNGGHPPDGVSPGGYLSLFTPQGGDRLRGGVSLFYLNHSLQSSNISPDLEREGLFKSHGFHYMMDGNVHISGPLIPHKLHFFSSLTAFDLSRDLAEFQAYDTSNLVSGILGLTLLSGRSRFRFFWTGQRLSHPTYGAERRVAASATNDRRELFNAAQLLYEIRLRPHHHLRIGAGFVQGDIRSDFQTDILQPYTTDIFRGNPEGAALMASDDLRRTFALHGRGDLWWDNTLGVRHRLQYGWQWRLSSTSSEKEIWDNLHLRMYRERALEVARYNTPLRHFESGRDFDFYVQDTVIFDNLIAFYAGLVLSSRKAWVPDNSEAYSQTAPDFNPDSGSEIRWFDLAPRLGFIIPLTPSRAAALKISFARYFYGLPLSYLTYGNPYAPAGLVYAWNDQNRDGVFQDQEAGRLIRREGPFYSRIDPDIQRPRTDEVAISFSTGFSGWTFVLCGYTRITKNLIHGVNTGVPFSAYDPQYHIDHGDDQVPFTYDDLVFTVFNQKPESLGQDLFLLTNAEPDTRNTVYFGADLNLVKRFGERFTFFLSLTAIQADGSTNPGNSEFENDDGMVGRLFDDPNTLINAKGRLRFDRGYTGRLGFNWLIPWDIRLGCVIKYYDGQPFARKIIIEGFNQGPFYIQANPRGVSRYEYNRTIDVRIEKILRWGDSARLRFILDGFNILNRGLATKENEWTRPEYPERHATEIQSPRIFRMGLAFEF
jgi:hypothetical protein